MLGDAEKTGLTGASEPAGVTTVPVDVPPSHGHPTPSLHWRRTTTGLTIRAPRARHLLPALAGVAITCLALAFITYRLATLPEARGNADRLGSVLLLILPCAFGLMALFTLLPVICPPRLRLDASGAATLLMPSGFRLVRCRLPAGTFELRTHQWVKGGPKKLSTLFLRDRRTHQTYPVFHKYPASELADIVRSLRRPTPVR